MNCRKMWDNVMNFIEATKYLKRDKNNRIVRRKHAGPRLPKYWVYTDDYGYEYVWNGRDGGDFFPSMEDVLAEDWVPVVDEMFENGRFREGWVW